MIAREGWLAVLGVAGAAAALTWQWGLAWSAPLWLLAVGLGLLLRLPRRAMDALPLALVSPVDGTVLSTREVDDPWLERRALSVLLAVRFPGVTVLYSPTEGKVMDFRTRGGGGREGAALAHSPTRYALWIRTDEGDDVTLTVDARRYISRFRADVAPGERIGQGKRIGFVCFATRIEVLAPRGSRCRVAQGRPIPARAGVLAVLVHEPPAAPGSPGAGGSAPGAGRDPAAAGGYHAGDHSSRT